MMEKELGYIDSAFSLNKMAIKLYAREGYLLGTALPHSEIADLFYSKKQLDSALYYINKAIDFCEQVGYTGTIEEYHDRKTKILEAKHDYQGALASNKLARQAREKKYADETKKSVAEIENSYENRLKEQQIRTLTTEKQLHEAMDRQQSENSIVIITCTIVIAFALAYVVYKRQQYLSKVRATQQQLQLKDQKDKIARNLHDDLGGQLSSIAIGLNRAISQPDGHALLEIQTIANRAITEFRDMLWAMDKEIFSLEELGQRVNTLFWEYRKLDWPVDFELSVQSDLSEVHVSSEVASSLYRIIQEAVHNSLKHSQADRVHVSIENGNGTLKLKIADNGKGFAWPASQEDKHFGLRNMQKRAEQIRAYFKIDSLPLQGTTIAIEVKIDAKKKISAIKDSSTY